MDAECVSIFPGKLLFLILGLMCMFVDALHRTILRFS